MIITDSTIFGVWKKSFEEVLSRGVDAISPLVYSIKFNGESSPDIIPVGATIDDFMQAQGKNKINTTANTIFPNSLWNRNLERSHLYDRYNRIAPTLRKEKGNYRGVYFDRIINYGYQYGCDKYPINQLEHVINIFLEGNRRRSALHLSIFDPMLDHVRSRQRGFPCLLHLFISPINDNGISITGIYGTQYVIDRALGNLLGIYRLGEFFAYQVGCELSEVKCIVSQSKLSGTVGKTEARQLLSNIKRDL